MLSRCRLSSLSRVVCAILISNRVYVNSIRNGADHLFDDGSRARVQSDRFTVSLTTKSFWRSKVCSFFIQTRSVVHNVMYRNSRQLCRGNLPDLSGWQGLSLELSLLAIIGRWAVTTRGLDTVNNALFSSKHMMLDIDDGT